MQSNPNIDSVGIGNQLRTTKFDVNMRELNHVLTQGQLYMRYNHYILVLLPGASYVCSLQSDVMEGGVKQNLNGIYKKG